MINPTTPRKKIKSPFGTYFKQLEQVDNEMKSSTEYGSILILSLVEEIGEMSRAYLAKHGRKPSNLAAQNDETYQQELGDILVTIIRFARIKNIDLDKRIKYTIAKIKRRKTAPKI
jgi:NTP pyrophosphatase (non-canonical NTP hydrolase)